MENKLPSFTALKDKHQQLMQSYYQILALASTQPFLIDIFALLKRKEFSPSKEKILRVLIFVLTPVKFIFRLFCWKPLVDLFVELHMKNKAKEIRDIYIQLSQTINDDRKYYKKYKNWLITSASELELYSTSLASQKTIKELLTKFWTAILAIIVVILRVDNIFQALVNLVRFTPISSEYATFMASFFRISLNATMILMPLLVLSFWTKRALLHPAINIVFLGDFVISERNVYQKENEIFSLLHRDKIPEFPVDFFAFISPFLVFVVFVPILAWMEFSRNQILTSGFWIGILIVLASMVVLPIWNVISYWKLRKWK